MRKIVSIFITSNLLIWASHAQDLSEVTSHGLPAVGRSAVVWADFDNDGDLDVVITGINTAGNAISRWYKNNGNFTFTNAGAGLTPVKDGSLAVGDINQDGWIDLLLTGSDQTNQPISKLYKNEGNGIFSALPLSLPGTSSGSSFLRDINHDGYADILLTGSADSGNRLTAIFQNNANETFTEVTPLLTGMSHGSAIIADINKDAFPDLISNGINNSNQKTTTFYINEGNFVFSKKDIDLPAVRNSALAYADYDQDGYIDLLISGRKQYDLAITEVYTGQSNSTFAINQALPAVTESTAAWADFDQDGDADLVYAGWQGADPTTYVYRNQSHSLQQVTDLSLPGIGNGSITWADINRDGSPDLFLTGFTATGPECHVYSNHSATENTAPHPPAHLTATPQEDVVILQWDRATDAESLAKSLTYDLYLGSSPATGEIVSPLSDITNGFRKTVAYGNLQDTFAIIQNLPEGRYYWSVQAVDHSYTGSAFASEQTFVVCQDFTIEATATAVCPHDTVILQAGDADDQVQWFTTENPTIPFSHQRTVSIAVADSITVWAALIKQPLGCTLYDTLQITVYPLPFVSVGKDTVVCYQEPIQLTAETLPDHVVNWYSMQQGLLAENTHQLRWIASANDTIVAEVINENQCVSYDTLVVEVADIPTVDLGPDQAVCPGERILLAVNNAVDSVSWFSAKQGLLAQHVQQIDFLAEQPDTLWVEVINKTGCTSYDSAVVTFRPLPKAVAGEDQIICPGASALLGSDDQNTEGYTFSWTPVVGLNNPEIVQPLASPDTTTAYILQVTNAWGCVHYDTVVVKVHEPGTPHAGEDKIICLGESVVLGSVPASLESSQSYQYAWFPTESLDDPYSARPMATPQQTTTYRAIVRNAPCFIDTFYVTVTVSDPPTITVSPDITIGFQEETLLEATGGIDYQWSPAEGLSAADIAQPVAAPPKTTTYTVKVTDSLGCATTGQVTVTIKNEVFIPSLFTPNGDGHNDTFQIYGYGIQALVFSIYTPDGQLVYKTSSFAEVMQQGWDGNYQGVPQAMGNYLWTLQGSFHDGQPILWQGKNSGMVRLIR